MSEPALPDAPGVSVVVPYYGDADTIAACLRSIRGQTIASGIEVLVVDDGSPQPPSAEATALADRIIRQDNAGPAGARNTGARAARGAILLFLDADCEAPPDWAERTVATLRETGAAAAMMMLSCPLDHPVARLTQGEIDERYRLLERGADIDFIAAAACACRRDVFEAVGGFDPLFRYNEDVEFAYRLNARDIRIVLIPDVRVMHRHPTSLRGYFLTKFHRGIWRMWLYRRYPNKSVSDSWTPQTLKLQIVTLGTAGLALVPALLWPPAWWIVLAALAGFLLAALSLARTAPRQIPHMTPPLAFGLGLAFVAVRTAALGMAVVVAHFRRPPFATVATRSS